MNEITPTDPLSNEAVLTPPTLAGENTTSRLRLFVDWLNTTNRHWTRPELAIYRNHLLAERSPATVQAYLSTIRAQYQRIMTDNTLRRHMLDAAPAESLAERRAFVEELLDQLRNDIHPINTRVNVLTKQDHTDNEHLRLSPAQALELIHAPGTDSLKGLRDTVAIALMLTTGVRKFELCAIHVRHLRHRLDGQLALLVPEGKGQKQRLVPYGAFGWILPLTEHWTLRAGITDGPLIRGFYKGNKKVRKTALRPRSVRYLLKDYPLVIDGELREVEPHDLRRSYARLLYDAKMRPEVIQQNLGHSSVATTLGYIGQADAAQRKPPGGILHFDISDLLR